MSADYVELEARLRSCKTGGWITLSDQSVEPLVEVAANAIADLRKQRDEARADRDWLIREHGSATGELVTRAEAAERERDRYKALAEGELERAAKVARECMAQTEAELRILRKRGGADYLLHKQAEDIATLIAALPAPTLDTGGSDA